MPIHRGVDSRGSFFAWGNHGHKYYYTRGDPVSRARSRRAAGRQAAAAYANGYRGAGLADIATGLANRVTGLLFGAQGPPNAVRQLLERHGRERIVSMTVCRVPLQSALRRVLDVLSLGHLAKVQKALSYDDIFHLYLQVRTANGTGFMIEKNQVVKVVYGSLPARPGSSAMAVFPIAGGTTVSSLVGNAWKARGVSLWRYSAFGNNCQNFVESLLGSSGMLTPQLRAFIHQDVNEIVKAFPRGTSAVANLLTDLAARLDIGLLGSGMRRGRGVGGTIRNLHLLQPLPSGV